MDKRRCVRAPSLYAYARPSFVPILLTVNYICPKNAEIFPPNHLSYFSHELVIPEQEIPC